MDLRLARLKEGAEHALGKKIVFSDGPAESRIMLVGEAPGRFEEEQGKPFVGRAGKTLNKALEKAGLSRGEVYITNTVLWRPPNNRKPNKEEVEMCKPYLVEQVRIIQPKIICTLGNTPLESFVKKAIITDVHGKITPAEIGGLPVNLLPTFHPAAILYNRKLLPLFENDIAKLKSYQ